MESGFEFEHAGYRFTVRGEHQPDRDLHELYYRGHYLTTQVSNRDATQAEVIAQFIAWLSDHPVPPYECHGGPLDGELIDERGPAFIPPGVRAGQYRRHGKDYEWQQ